MAYLGDIQTRGQIRDINQVMDYLRQLEDQIRYALFNLDGENIQNGAIGAEQLSQGVNGEIKDAKSTAENSKKAAKRAQKTADKNTQSIGTLSDQVTTLSSKAVQVSAGSSSARLYVGSGRPNGHGVVWIKPGADLGDGTKDCQVLYVE